MSYDLIASVRADRVPTATQLGPALAAGTPSVRLVHPIDPETWSGYVPVELDGRRTGFEAVVGPDEGARGHWRALLSAGDGLEIEAARIVARAIARLAGGSVHDPQTGVTEAAP